MNGGVYIQSLSDLGLPAQDCKDQNARKLLGTWKRLSRASPHRIAVEKTGAIESDCILPESTRLYKICACYEVETLGSCRVL